MVHYSERSLGERLKPYTYDGRELDLARAALTALVWHEKTDPQEAIRKAGLAIAFKVNEYSGKDTRDRDIIDTHVDYACFMLGITVPIREIEKRLDAPEEHLEGPRIPVFNGLQGRLRFPNSCREIREHLQGIIDRHTNAQPWRSTSRF